MTTLITKTESDVRVWGGVSFSISVHLADLEQIVIDVPVYEWRGGQNNLIGTEKGRLEALHYDFKRDVDEPMRLSHIIVRGFRQDKRLKARTNHLYRVTNEVIAQIPDEYHDYARKAFAEKISSNRQELLTMEANGLEIKEDSY
jgi:hypothetical protein